MEAEIVLTVLELVPWTRGAGRLEGSKGGLDIHTHTKIKKKKATNGLSLNQIFWLICLLDL